MEPPPPSFSSTAVASTSIPSATAPVPPPPPHVTSSYPESLDSSPRSRTTDGWDELPATSGAGGGSTVSSKLRLMCSYGGHILPRPHDKSLCYMGGDTRIVVVDRNSSLSSLVARLSNTLINGRSFTLKYQLPSEDLDSLISVTTDEDLDNMIEEYDRTISASNSTKQSRLRLFLFTSKPEATQSMGQILESSAKSDDWFLNALNSAGLLNRGFSDSDTNVNRLLGLDDALTHRSNSGDNNANNRDGDDGGSVKSAKQQQQQQIQQPPPPPQQQQQQQQGGGQDVHCLPDSPMLDTSSSFGSTSSSPSLAHLPPIRVHVEEPCGVKTMPDQRNLGIEEQFARINVGNKHLQLHQDDGFAAISSPPPMPVTIALPAAPVSNAATVSNEFQTRVISDDERSDHGVPAGYRKPPTPRAQPQNLPPQQVHQPKSNSELPSPNSVSSDSSMNNPMFHQRPSVYQEPIAPMPSASTLVTGMINPSDPSTLLSQNQNQNQNQDPSYILHPQFEQQSIQSQPQPQHQQQQQQQFIHAAAPHYVQHHPSSALPVPTYIHVYPSQQQQQSFHRHPGQHDQQPYPVYYVTAPVPPRPYSMPVPQSASVSESPGSLPSNHPQAPPNSTMMPPPPPNNHMRSVPGGKPEMGQAGIYTTAPGVGGAQMVHQIPTSQPQFMGYSQIHHPPQSGSAGNPNYGFEYADNAHTHIYYTQPLGHAQYQTMTGPPPAMVMPDGSTAAKLPAENLSQQIRSSQPL